MALHGSKSSAEMLITSITDIFGITMFICNHGNKRPGLEHLSSFPNYVLNDDDYIAVLANDDISYRPSAVWRHSGGSVSTFWVLTGSPELHCCVLNCFGLF